MGILVDSTVLILAERSAISPRELLQTIVASYGNAETGVSVITLM